MGDVAWVHDKNDVDEALDIQHHFGGKVYAKQALIRAGSRARQHAHKFDHLSILASGSVQLTVDGVSSTHVGPSVITIGAGKVHEVYALQDSVWFCIHATDLTDPDEIDEEVIA